MVINNSDPVDAIPAVQYRKPIRGSLVWWLRCLGLLAFLVVLLRLTPGSNHVELSRFDPRWLGVCMLLTILHLVLEVCTWQWLLSMQGISSPYPKTLTNYLASQYLGSVTPGHVGEFLASGYVSMDTGITVGYALSSIVMKKILNWVAMIGFGLMALPLLAEVTLKQGAQKFLLLGILALVILAGGIAVWVLSLRRLAKKWEKLSPWQIDMTEFWSGMRQLTVPQLAIGLAIAAVAFSVLFFQLDAVLRSLGIALPFVLVAQVVALSRIGGRTVPFSVFGWGSKDVAMIILLGSLGIAESIGLTVTLLLLVSSYLLTLLLSGLCWWLKPLVVPRARPVAAP